MNNNSTKNIEDSKEKKISCKLCKGETIFLGDHKVLSNKKTGVYFCKNCQSLFRFPMPTEEDLYKYYENIPFRKPTGYRRHFLHKRLRKTKRQAQAIKNTLINNGYDKNTKILDLGAGIGGLIRELKSLGFSNVFGIEGRKQAREYCMSEFNIKLESGWIFDAHKIFPDVQVICLSHVLEHLDKPWEVFEYLKKYYPNALLWIEVPNGELSSKNYSGDVLWNVWLSEHLWAYSRKGLISLFKRYDIKILEINSGRHYPFYEWIRKFEFSFARLLFIYGRNVNLNFKKIITIISRILFIYVPIKTYKFLINNLPLVSLPDEPYYLRIVGKSDDDKT